MKREILFRGKRVDNGEWIEVENISTTDGLPLKAFALVGWDWEQDGVDIGRTYWIEVDPETVGQFTGLLDKNGVKVFEGDIVRYEQRAAHFSRIGKVYFADETELDWRLDTLVPLSKWHKFGKTIEVIGNIHDNAELLKSSKEEYDEKES